MLREYATAIFYALIDAAALIIAVSGLYVWLSIYFSPIGGIQ